MTRRTNDNQIDIKTHNDPISSLNHFNSNDNKTHVFNSRTNNLLKSHNTDELKYLKPGKKFGK